MSVASITLPAAAVRWELSGPAGPHVDTLVAGLIGAGMTLEPIEAGKRYRVDGAQDVLTVLAAELAGAGADVALQHEMPPVDKITMRSTLAPLPEFRRSVTIHGTGAAFGYVARAVDRGLRVATAGVNRWIVGGRTAGLVDWLATVHQKTAEEVLALWQWTPESVAAEDAVTHSVSVTLPPVAVDVKLPDRKTTTEIARDTFGEIVNVVMLEKSV